MKGTDLFQKIQHQPINVSGLGGLQLSGLTIKKNLNIVAVEDSESELSSEEDSSSEEEEGHSNEEKKVNKPISRLIHFNTFNKGRIDMGAIVE